jgi:hypothetical protein
MSVACGGHQRIDERSLAMHRAIADKLRANPSLIEVARENLHRWSLQNGRSQPYGDTWRGLLERPIEELLSCMVEENDAMTALRQATPFAGILTPAERWAIYTDFQPGRCGTT